MLPARFPAPRACRAPRGGGAHALRGIRARADVHGRRRSSRRPLHARCLSPAGNLRRGADGGDAEGGGGARFIPARIRRAAIRGDGGAAARAEGRRRRGEAARAREGCGVPSRPPRDLLADPRSERHGERRPHPFQLPRRGRQSGHLRSKRHLRADAGRAKFHGRNSRAPPRAYGDHGAFAHLLYPAPPESLGADLGLYRRPRPRGVTSRSARSSICPAPMRRAR